MLRSTILHATLAANRTWMRERKPMLFEYGMPVMTKAKKSRQARSPVVRLRCAACSENSAAYAIG